MTVRERATAARQAARALPTVDATTRGAVLAALAEAIERSVDAILAVNAADLATARSDGLAAPLLHRLELSASKVRQMAVGVRSVSRLPDPIWSLGLRRELAPGLTLEQRSVPIGVVGIVFESRPDALIQFAALAIKSGNALVLKGGSEAAGSNRLLAQLATDAAGMPEGWLQLLHSRAEVTDLLQLDDLVDLIVPRGSNAFVRHIMDHSRIPVLGHADGVCHVYIAPSADIETARAVVVDSKTQYVAVCNAAETLLVDAAVANALLPRLAADLAAAGVEVRGCDRSRAIAPGLVPARASDWGAEYLDSIIAVRVVDGVEAAIEHIHRYGSKHTDAIVTEDAAIAERFTRAVDTASVMWNASTRFADGFRYGLGAEVGISTAKIHARGPVGVEGLMSRKWIVRGQGHTVADFARGARRFTHRDLG